MIRHPLDRRARSGELYSTLFMRRQLRDPEVRRKAWPDYTFGCKRILFSSHYLPALERRQRRAGHRPGHRRSTPDGVRTDDGRHHPADVLIWGTGFTHDRVHVPDGRSSGADGRDAAGGVGATAPTPTCGMTVPGLPVAVRALRAEHQHLGRLDHRLPRGAGRATCARRSRRPRAGRGRGLEVRRDVEQAFDRRLQARVRGHGVDAVRLLVPRRRRAASSPTGRGYMEQYVRAVARIDPAEYDFICAR